MAKGSSVYLNSPEATSRGMLIAKKKAEKLEKLLLKALPPDTTAGGEGDRLALEEAEPERFGDLLETQMRGLEEAARLRLDDIQKQCWVAKSAAKNLEDLLNKIRKKSGLDPPSPNFDFEVH